MKTRIEQVAEMVTGETAGAISYFLEGNKTQDRYPPSVDQLFKRDGAIAALNSAYWSKAMHLTDVLNYMPQKRRDEWHASIRDQTCPAFDEGTVRDTITGLLNMRSQFLAERVDGIFRGLSGEHVTNSPAAFGKRMIVGYVSRRLRTLLSCVTALNIWAMFLRSMEWPLVFMIAGLLIVYMQSARWQRR